MKKLFNISDFSCENDLLKKIEKYKKIYKFHGVELIKFYPKNNFLIKNEVIGYHLRFFPMWIGLYLENFKEIQAELSLENTDEIFYLCGGKTKKEMISFYKDELNRAKELNVEYVVIHGCNIRPSETFTYNFHYTDLEILKYFSEIINEIFSEEYTFKLLLENLWWPGLKLQNKNEMEYLLKNITYKNIGFMLDTGHLLNTNLNLENSNEGIEYIKKTIENLKEYKTYIKGVHLNYSLSGKYVKDILKNNKKDNIYNHISKIDSHLPFENSKIKEILIELELDYLVYEFTSYEDKEYEEKIKIQDKSLF